MHYVWDFAILAKYGHLFWLGLNIPAHVAAVSVLTLSGTDLFRDPVSRDAARARREDAARPAR